MSSSLVGEASVERLSGVTEQKALLLGQALLAAAYSDKSLADIFGAVEMRGRGGRNLPRLLYLTRQIAPLNTLVRLFLLGVGVSVEDAKSAFAPMPVEEWLDAGFVETIGDEVRALVRIFPFDGLLLVMDPPELLEQGTGPDFVSGLTNSTAALMCCTIRKPSRSTLDLGTGCGVLAFLAARHSERVLATDLNPRALCMARLNARLNGLPGIEFALGSGFEPVGERKFDLIVSNPPFILGPGKRYTFRDSGMELDGLCRKLVAEAPQHLEEGGFFQCELEWPVPRGEDWKERLSGWLRDTGCDALVLRTATSTWQEHTEEMVVDTDVSDPEIQAQLFGASADYLEERGIESVGQGFITMRRRTQGAPNWIQIEETKTEKMEPFSDAVLQVFEAHDALDALPAEGLLETRVRLAPGLLFETGREWSGTGWSPLIFRLRQPKGLCLQAGLDSAMAGLIQRCDGTATLRQILGAMATGLKVEFQAIVPGALAMLRGMLERGFLTIGE